VSDITLLRDPAHQVFSPDADILAVEPELNAGAVRGGEIVNHTVHAVPTDDQIMRTVFLIVMGSAIAFIAATIYLSHM
jgi:hypothetical protein